VAAYLSFILAQKGIQKHAFIRGIYGLYQKVAVSVFVKTVQRALKYRITDLHTLQRIAVLQLQEGSYELPLVDPPEELQNRESYREGCYTDEGELPVEEAESEAGDG